MEEGEEIVLKVHRHWLFIATRILGLCGMLVLPLVLIILVERLGLVVFSAGSTAALVSLWALWGLVLWVVFWQFWTTYYMDIWVVTTKRIIDIDYLRLFDRSIAMLRLDRVQDLSTRIQGIVATLFKYGSVIVQSAGTKEEFVIDQIANPEALRDTINTLVGRIAQRSV